MTFQDRMGLVTSKGPSRKSITYAELAMSGGLLTLSSAATAASVTSDGGLPIWVALGGGAGATIAFLIPILTDVRRRRRAVKEAHEDPRERLRSRIREVNDAFTGAAILMNELRRDLEAQQAARDALLNEAERQQELLEINQERAEKIRRILVHETKTTIRAERRREWMFFGLGVVVSAVASVPIGIWVNSIS